MDITFYWNESANNVINKNLKNAKTLEIKLKRNFDVETPEIIISTIDVSNYNYFFLAGGINRYYFIEDTEIMAGGVIRILASCDYIETFKHEILNSKGIYKKVVNDGDYGDLDVVTTGVYDTIEHVSNVTLEPDNKAILSVMGGFYG